MAGSDQTRDSQMARHNPCTPITRPFQTPVRQALLEEETRSRAGEDGRSGSTRTRGTESSPPAPDGRVDAGVQEGAGAGKPRRTVCSLGRTGGGCGSWSWGSVRAAGSRHLEAKGKAHSKAEVKLRRMMVCPKVTTAARRCPSSAAPNAAGLVGGGGSFAPGPRQGPRPQWVGRRYRKNKGSPRGNASSRPEEPLPGASSCPSRRQTGRGRATAAIPARL